MRVTDRQLAALAADALAPGVRDELLSAIAGNPELGARLARLRQDLRAPPGGPRWILPPPGQGWGLSARVETAWVMGEEAVRVELQGTPHATQRLFVAARVGDTWSVVWPVGPAVPATTLPWSGAGQLTMRVRIPPEATKLAAMLVPSDLVRSGDPSEWIPRALASGRCQTVVAWVIDEPTPT